MEVIGTDSRKYCEDIDILALAKTIAWNGLADSVPRFAENNRLEWPRDSVPRKQVDTVLPRTVRSY